MGGISARHLRATYSAYKPIRMNPDDRNDNRLEAHHEAAHAVIAWQLGFGVKMVWLDRVKHCGHMKPLRRVKGRAGKVGHAVLMCAGVAFQAAVDGEEDAELLHRCHDDLRRSLITLEIPTDLMDGEQFAVAVRLVQRTRRLMESPAVRRQVRSIARPLMRDGCLLARQVDALLKNHTDTPAVARTCRDFVEELASEIDSIVSSARGSGLSLSGRQG